MERGYSINSNLIISTENEVKIFYEKILQAILDSMSINPDRYILVPIEKEPSIIQKIIEHLKNNGFQTEIFRKYSETCLTISIGW